MTAVLAAALVLGAIAVATPITAAAQDYSNEGQQEAPAQSTTQSGEEDGGDSGGPPIWAGIGLILLAAAAGTLAARARNRRRMREYLDQ
jgi:hypothetical protein